MDATANYTSKVTSTMICSVEPVNLRYISMDLANSRCTYAEVQEIVVIHDHRNHLNARGIMYRTMFMPNHNCP